MRKGTFQYIEQILIDYNQTEKHIQQRINELMVKQFGENWNSIENLRKYQEKKNIVKDFDGERMKEIRIRKGGTILVYSEMLGIGNDRLSNLEKGISKPLNWKEYLKLKALYKGDLLKESAVKKKNAKYTTKEFITFKNVGGRWEMGKLVKQEVV